MTFILVSTRVLFHSRQPLPGVLELGLAGVGVLPEVEEFHMSFLPLARTSDVGEYIARIAAVEITLSQLYDNRPEEAVLFLESALAFRDKSLEINEKPSINSSIGHLDQGMAEPKARSRTNRN
jgi:hypothetical protein